MALLQARTAAQLEMIDHCERYVGLDQGIPEYMTMPFTTEDMNPRLYNALKALGLLTLDAIRNYDLAEYEIPRAVGKKLMFDLKELVQENGGWFLSAHKNPAYVAGQMEKGEIAFVKRQEDLAARNSPLLPHPSDETLKKISILKLFDPALHQEFNVESVTDRSRHVGVKNQLKRFLHIEEEDHVFALRSLSTDDMRKKGLGKGATAYFRSMIYEISGAFKGDQNLSRSTGAAEEFYNQYKDIISVEEPKNSPKSSLKL